MTRTSIRELVESWRPRYLKASRKQKTKILDEFVALTGYHRNATIDRLLKTHRPKPLLGRSTTKPGTLLRHQIPVRTFAELG